MKLAIQLVLFVFIVTALFYVAAKMGYIEVTAQGETALKTVLGDMFTYAKTLVANIFRSIADKIQS